MGGRPLQIFSAWLRRLATPLGQLKKKEKRLCCPAKEN